MVKSDKQSYNNNNNNNNNTDREIDDVDSVDDLMAVDSSPAAESLSEVLEGIFVEDGDGDLVVQRNREDIVLRFLQALDMQVMGACRSDERLKPFLKLNVSSGAAEDLLLAHLSQHFEPAEIGMLARCLCIPLVSIRVGKIKEQGALLCPTDKRGNLNLILLPTSDLRILFLGDDGCIERLATFSFGTKNSNIEIKDIPADRSGRSFSLKIHGDKVYYFWCSERSKLLGDELLRKMKDLLSRRPNLSELTGISESRLDCFSTQLRAYLPGSSLPSAQAGSTHAEPTSVDNSLESLDFSTQSTTTYSKSLRQWHHGTNGVKSSSFCQGSLSPRPSTFKEGTPRNLSSLKCVATEKIERRGDGYLSCIDGLTSPSSGTCLPKSDNGKFPEAVEGFPFPPVETIGRLGDSSSLLPPASVTPLGSPFFSPYYVWCPPVAATPPHSSRSFSQLPVSSCESLSLPSLSTILSPVKSSSLLSSIPPLNVVELPPLEFPPLFPEPLVRSQVSTSQQILTFTPLMCDSIVHIPVIDVCSSGQGYLVSAGPGIQTTIPPLHPNFMNPLIPESESVVEKSARETLRLLINSSNQPNSLLDVLPSVIISSDERPNIFAAGSRGLYSGTRDVHAITNSIAAMGLVQMGGDPFEGGHARRNIGRKESMNPLENSAHSATSGFSEGQADARGDEGSGTTDF